MAEQPSGFKELLSSMMKRRWFITAIVLGGFMVIIMGIFGAILNKSAIEGEWKELLLLLLGAFIGSYGKIDEYFAHRQCEHVWGDLDGDGTEECLKCGKIRDEDAEQVG